MYYKLDFMFNYLLKQAINIVILFFLLTGLLTAQERQPGFERINIEEGLSQSEILTIFQDSRGFLWIGSQDGLNRYDGYEFITYRNSPFDKNSLSNNYISAIAEDSSGYLWICTLTGLNMYDRYKDKFENIKIDNGKKSLLNGVIYKSVVVDRSNNIWLGGINTGLIKYDPVKKTSVHFRKGKVDTGTINSDTINVIYEDLSGNLWLGKHDGLYVFNPKTRSFKEFKFNANDKQTISDNFVRCIIQDKKGFLWIGTDKGGLNKLNIKTGKFTRYMHSPYAANTISGNSINSLQKDQDGNIWIGVWGGGLNKLDTKTGIFTYYKNVPTDPQSLSNNDLTVVYEDRTGVLWVGTYGGGLNKLKPLYKPFILYKHNPLDNKSLSHNRIYAIYKDRESILWVGTWGGGLDMFEPKTNTFVHHEHDPGNPSSISNDRVTSIAEDNDGILWIGTLDGGLNAFDKKTNKFTHFDNNPRYLKSAFNKRITSLLFDSEGLLWIGTFENGVSIYNKSTGAFTHLSYDLRDINTLSNSRINSLFEDDNGNVWIGTYSGLNKYDRKNKKISRFFHNPSDTLSLGSDLINSVSQASDGSIWVATSGGGLNKLVNNNNNFEFVKYNIKDGLPSNIIYQMLQDKKDNMWISTNNGLVKFNTEPFSLRIYTYADGLQSNEFKKGAFYDKENNILYFGGINGFNAFNPDSIKDDPVKPKILFTKFRLFNKEVGIGNNSPLQESISETKTITLSHDQSFSIEFAAIYFASPDNIKYAYMLKGFDNGWNYTDSKMRYASYTNLPGSKYTLYVKATNNEGVWSNDYISLSIIITPPFWMTWWFRAVVLILALGTILFIYRYRTRAIRESNKILEEKVKLRTQELIEANQTKDRFFSIIAHDLKNPFTIFYGYTEILNKDIEALPKEEVRNLATSIFESASKIHVLLHNLLQWAQIQMGGFTVEPVELNLKSLSESVLFTVSDNANQKGITIKNNIAGDIKAFADEHMINTVIRNLVSNAIKFTNKNGYVEIGASNKNDMCEIYIKDNGIGIRKEEIPEIFKIDSKITNKGTNNETGTGLGLTLCKDFVKKNNGDIWIESELGKGTTVKFTLPVSRK